MLASLSFWVTVCNGHGPPAVPGDQQEIGACRCGWALGLSEIRLVGMRQHCAADTVAQPNRGREVVAI
jgi:hypothetical protein